MTTDRELLEWARVGDSVECEVQSPAPETIRMTLLTPESVAYANELLARKNTGWRLVRAAASIGQQKGE